MMLPPPRSTLFPYTTLFRSQVGEVANYQLGPDARAVILRAVIRQEYAPLVRWNSKFWNAGGLTDRKSTRLTSSHMSISYAVFCLKKKKYQIDCLNFYSINIT